MNPFEQIANLADKAGDPELALQSRLYNAAFGSSFGMMSKAWTGWDDNAQSGNTDDGGMGAFLAPADNTMKVINDELLKGVENLY